MSNSQRASIGKMRLVVSADGNKALQKAIRDPKSGQWVRRDHASISREMGAMARDAQRQIVELQERSFRRQRPGTGRLKRATLDSRNVSWDWLGFGVGDFEWLETGSPARYARTIEEGSEATWVRTPFRMLELRGRWGSVGGNVLPGSGGRLNAVSGFGKESWGRGFYRPVPFMNLFTPKREIAPMKAYERVARSTKNRERASTHARNVFDRAMRQATLNAQAAAEAPVAPWMKW